MPESAKRKGLPFYLTRLFSYLYSEIEIGVIGGNSDLTYDYQHLGNNASALDDVLSGKSEFAKKFSSAKNPMIIVGSDCLKGEQGNAILAKVQELSNKLQSNTSSKVFNVLHQWAAQVGALDLGYKVEQFYNWCT